MLYILFGILLGVFIYKLLRSSKYWEERNIVHEPALPIVGNLGSAILGKKHLMDVLLDIYNKYPNERYVGMMQFTHPMLLIRDVNLIKQFTVKDFEHFHDHFAFSRTHNDPVMSKSLISLDGYEWKQMRTTLSPVFSSSKLRTMYHLMTECAVNFVGHFRGKEQIAINMKDIFSRFAADVIATTAFGIEINSLNEPKNSFFTNVARFNRGIIHFAKILILSKFPFLVDLLGAYVFPIDVTNFFRSIVKDNIEKRERDNIVRADLIHLLMEARKGRLSSDIDTNKNEGFATVEESDIGQNIKHIELTDDDIVAQAMLFFVAGFDTVSTAACFIAYELAVHPDIQKKLQKEIDEVNQACKKNVPYETLLAMKYLDQVVSETLRLWPPGFQTDRTCTKDYIIPPKHSNEREVVLQKGSTILIPIAAIHRDPQYFPNPEKFDPERFNNENKSKIVPGSYMPFGIGPRSCIASRFGLLEVKTLFFHLLSRFDIVPITGTEIPVLLSPKKTSLEPRNGFKVGIRPRKM